MSLDEQLRENKRTVNKAVRELSREQAQLEREKVRLEREIKKLAYVLATVPAVAVLAAPSAPRTLCSASLTLSPVASQRPKRDGGRQGHGQGPREDPPAHQQVHRHEEQPAEPVAADAGACGRVAPPVPRAAAARESGAKYW
jgi:hypothetical protein